MVQRELRECNNDGVYERIEVVFINKKICMIGQFPPPVHGLSKALETIKLSKLSDMYDFKCIDIKNNKRILYHALNILFCGCNIFYFTISFSKWGNMRDLFLLFLMHCKRNAKVIIHAHGGYYKELFRSQNKFVQYLNKMIVGKVDTGIVLGNSLREMFSDVLEGRKIRIIENFIEDSCLSSDDEFASKLINIENEEIKVLYLSNFIESKGYMDILRAAKILKEKGQKAIRFIFAGTFFDDNKKREFLKTIADMDLAEEVEVEGYVHGEKKRKLLMESHIFVLPTYYVYEGQPISIIEAMGNGLTIITTRHKGIPDIVSEENGYFVDIQAPEQIAQKLIGIIEEKSILNKFALNNRKKVVNHYLEKEYIRKIDLAFREIQS